MPKPPPAELGSLSLAEIEALIAGDTPPPVERWHPASCGDSGMRIARDGRWYHDGALIARPELVRLFSTILRREPDGSFVLVTPHEMLSIAVEDAPFTAVELRVDGAGEETQLTFRLNAGALVVAGADHPLAVRAGREGPRPYLTVRSGLAALVARPVYYQLADRAVERDGRSGVWSGGAFFSLEPQL